MTIRGLTAACLLLFGTGCSDRLAEMQTHMAGTWTLESREMPDGTLLRAPRVSGTFTWSPVDSRKAHVGLNVHVAEGHGRQRTFDYASSTYEISTSAITRKRHLLLRQGYRSSAEAPITVYPKAKTSKGKISVENGSVRISHEEGFSQVFDGDTMVSAFPDAFRDTWKRSP
jgi:hypothetical protein